MSYLSTYVLRLASVLMLLLIFAAPSYSQYSVATLPNPKQQQADNYVSNPDGILSGNTVAELNRISQTLQQQAGTEFAVVAIADYEGSDLFEFALQTFNSWGIGKQGANNGLLLIVAKNKREYRFISGYGLEGLLPDVYLLRIGEKYLVPHFQQQDYDQGILAAAGAVAQILNSPDAQAELHRMLPETVPFFSWQNPYFRDSLMVFGLYVLLYIGLHVYSRRFVGNRSNDKKSGCSGWWVYLILAFLAMIFTILFSSFYFAFVHRDMGALYNLSSIPYFVLLFGSYWLMCKIIEVRKSIGNSYHDEKNSLDALRDFQRKAIWAYVFSPLMFFNFGHFQRKWVKKQKRFRAPKKGGPWQRVDRDQVSDTDLHSYLDAGERMEEQLKVITYQIWINQASKEVKKVIWKEANYKLHDKCPSCEYRTYKLRQAEVLQAATSKSTGSQQIYNQCAFCDHREDLRIETIPRISSSSSGSGGSSGRSSGGSGGGSFGSGSSGGGGAGGRW